MVSRTLKEFYFLWKQRKFWLIAGKGPEEIFADVYKRNIWGGEKGDFCSGEGSTHSNTAIYVKNLVQFIHQNRVNKIVELGCGDFRIMKKVLAQTNVHYIGIDIVGDLIEFNKKHFGSDRIQFQQCNIIDDHLPEGDLVIVRQVMQHLSNTGITKILAKISRYRWAYITEQIPIHGQIEFNIDKIHGPHIRLKANSGVFIDEPPFNVKNSTIQFEYRQDETIKGKLVPAVIRTYSISRPFNG